MKTTSLMILCLLFSVTVSASTFKSSTSINVAGQSANKLMVKNREHAIQLVKQQYQGQILKAQASRVNGHPGYKVKLISKEGFVFYLSVDAQTGRISRN